MTAMFQVNGYELVDAVISNESAKLLSTEFEILRDNVFDINNMDLNSVGFYNDHQVEKSFSWYGAYCFESLLLYVKPIMERVTGKKLHPTYSYARIYYNGATMESHVDRPSCQYSATLTVDVDDSGPWDIWMKNLDAVSVPVKIPVGSMLVYRGDLLNHWRNEYKGTKQIQAFLHYVDADGEYADNIYDGRKMLGARSVGSK
jgi:hypothetical protein